MLRAQLQGQLWPFRRRPGARRVRAGAAVGRGHRRAGPHVQPLLAGRAARAVERREQHHRAELARARVVRRLGRLREAVALARGGRGAVAGAPPCRARAAPQRRERRAGAAGGARCVACRAAGDPSGRSVPGGLTAIFGRARAKHRRLFVSLATAEVVRGEV
eukprot:5579950-Prymnesium_polylepis.1